MSQVEKIKCVICDKHLDLKTIHDHHQQHLQEYRGSCKFKTIVVNESGQFIEEALVIEMYQTANKIKLTSEITTKSTERLILKFKSEK